MELPLWVEELRTRYLADAGHVFLLHGAVTGPVWGSEGSALDCERVLIEFLRRTRPIVGVLRPSPLPSRLEFADGTDRSRFENLIKAYDLLAGRAFPQDESEPQLALARIWRALSTTGTDQAYLLMDADTLLPSRRRKTAPIPDAPPLLDWPGHERLRRSNNVVVLLAPILDAVHADLRERCVVIEVIAASGPVAAPAPTPPSPPASAPLDLAELRAALAPELRAALERHPEAHRASLLPVLDALARVVHARRPTFTVPELALDADGALVAAGPGGERLLAAWRADIALDAAATMLVRSYAAGGVIDETAVAALAKRIARLLDRIA